MILIEQETLHHVVMILIEYEILGYCGISYHGILEIIVSATIIQIAISLGRWWGMVGAMSNYETTTMRQIRNLVNLVSWIFHSNQWLELLYCLYLELGLSNDFQKRSKIFKWMSKIKRAKRDRWKTITKNGWVYTCCKWNRTNVKCIHVRQ